MYTHIYTYIYRIIYFYINFIFVVPCIVILGWKKSNKMQQYADIYLLLNYSTCFGHPSHSSSAVRKTVVAASGDNTIWGASFFRCDQIRALGYATYWCIVNVVWRTACWVSVFDVEELNFLIDTAFGSCSGRSLALFVNTINTDVDVGWWESP